jgi:NADH-quinone oxidoreductase subunit L
MSLCLIILFPILGFLLNGFLHLSAIRVRKRVSANLSGTIATGAMIASFITAVYFFFQFHQTPAGSQFLVEEKLFQWMKLGGLTVDFALRLDQLSLIFTLVITGVGSLIHLYSVGYMHDDETPAKYFAYLNLFCFMMLNLVLGASLPHVFLGWEGVGLASYLLIGYWYDDPLKVFAGQKAFIMNRIGDLGFLIAMFVAYKFVGSLDLFKIQGATLSPHVATVFGLLIFFACTGKSAQIPLFTWLPDAMAGPTPVSALIHAATMVTSGIYLLTRLSPVISSSPTVMSVIAVIGATTALISALMACAQTDIKKVLAYSTISQLGFMFLACGVGAFDIGVFHVMTHAFFKALMFLGAGSVIHALHEQDIFKMGGLRKKLPITTLTFVAGWAAILGLPPFSGFFSKDEILWRTLNAPSGGIALFSVGLAAAFLTAFYMTRLLVLVFFGKSRLSPEAAKHAHESPLNMTLPLIVLGVFSVAGGWFGSPIHLGEAEVGHSSGQIGVMVASVVLALLAAFIAFQKYKNFNGQEKEFRFLKSGMGIDSAYGAVFGKGTSGFAQAISRFVEEMILQRIIRVSSALVDLSGNVFKVVQVGSAQAYLMMMMLAIFAIVAWIFLGVGQYGKL